MGFLQAIGRTFITGLEVFGRLVLFALAALLDVVRPPYYPRLVLKQMVES